jgi:DNA-binding LacI/PurR family transcriptional regulator
MLRESTTLVGQRRLSSCFWGVQATLGLLDTPQPPDALVATTPALARGMLDALGQHHVNVPEDIAVAAFIDGATLPDEITYATCEPIEELGRHAAQMLLDRIGGYVGPPRSFRLGYQLHIGSSSG